MKDYTLHLDYWELLNLHKALLEAKFHENPDNELISGSPFLADLYLQVRDLLLQSERSADWEAFFQLKNRPDLKQRAISRISKDERWKAASDAEKQKITGDYFAPFRYDQAELLEAVAQIDRSCQRRAKPVVVLPYDPAWKSAFAAIREELEPALDGLILGIEHVGSTSVEGLSAKPCIDIDVVIPDYAVFDSVVRALEAIGYRHEGDLGIRDREAFRYSGKPHLMKHHLYVCPAYSGELHRHITFRDYLRSNPEAVKEYGSIKETAAQLFPDNVDRYMAFKAPCIEELYRLCGLKP